jgi:hypothetical protein
MIPVSYLISLYRKIEREIRHYFMKLGISLEDFATFYSSDKAWFFKEYEQQSRHRGKVNPKLGWKIPRGLISVRKLVWSQVRQIQKLGWKIPWGLIFGEKTSLIPCELFSSWLLISSPVLTTMRPNIPSLAYFRDQSGLWSLSNWCTHLRDCLLAHHYKGKNDIVFRFIIEYSSYKGY